MTTEPKELLERHTALCQALTVSLRQAISAISAAHLELFFKEIGIQQACIREMNATEVRISKILASSGLSRNEFLRQPSIVAAAEVRERSFREMAAVNGIYRAVVKKSLVTCSALLHVTRQALLEIGPSGRELEIHV